MFKPGTMHFEKNRFFALEHRESSTNIIFNILKSYVYNLTILLRVFFFFFVLEIDPRARFMLSKCPITELYSHISLNISEMHMIYHNKCILKVKYIQGSSLLLHIQFFVLILAVQQGRTSV